VIERLQDEERSGAPATFSMEQVVELFASPVPNQADGRSATGQKQSWRMRWSSRVSESISLVMGRLLEEAQIKPHQIRYWLTPPDEEFDAKVSNITQLYNSCGWQQQGERTVCVDEMTGIQAKERLKSFEGS